jgi:hypothetical protein
VLLLFHLGYESLYTYFIIKCPVSCLFRLVNLPTPSRITYSSDILVGDCQIQFHTRCNHEKRLANQPLDVLRPFSGSCLLFEEVDGLCDELSALSLLSFAVELYELRAIEIFEEPEITYFVDNRLLEFALEPNDLSVP